MYVNWFIAVYSMVITIWGVYSTNQHNLQEYCTLETFQPTCNSNEVVIMDRSHYGRMKLGKCIDRDFGYVGCYQDVLPITDRICSGLSSCSVTVPNTNMNEEVYKKCLHRSISPYLEASYHCQQVHNPRNNHCIAPEKVELNNQDIYIASKTSTETSCGLHETPWIIEAKQGQQVDIEITDFSWTNSSVDDHNSHKSCTTNYGYILDMDNDDVITMCGGGRRHKHLYTSVGKSVQVMLDRTALESKKFLLHFRAIGCPVYQPPPHSWIQKENDSLEIGCLASAKKWKLKCVNHRWLGMVGNCSSPTILITQSTTDIYKVGPDSSYPDSSNNVPHVSNNHVIVFTLACLTLLICLSVIILGVYCTKRYEAKIKKYRHNNSILQQHKIPVTQRLPGTSTIYRPVTTIQPGTFKPPSVKTTTLKPPTYTFPLPKDEKAPKVPPRNGSFKANPPATIKEVNESTYQNMGDSDSVEYYILENPAEREMSEEMYQSIKLHRDTLS